MHSSKSFVFTFAFCVISFSIFGQSQIKEYVTSHTVRISPIDPSASNDSELEIIDKAIGSATIVMLGEQDHGDAATFQAKTRLIKYLHEKKGFDVLAFESDFFSLNEGWDHLKKEASQIKSFLRQNITPIWSDCDACSTLLFDYVPDTYTTDDPLEITGFDSDLVLDYSANNLILKLDSVLRHLVLPIAASSAYTRQILPVLDSLKWGLFSNLNESFYARSSAYLQEIKNQMTGKLGKDHFWIQVVDNLISANINHQSRNIDVIRSFNARDAQMAQNLKWLAQVKFSGKKMIVWAANTHIGKSTDTLMKNKSGEGFTSMGAFFTKDTFLFNQTYVLGFTSYKGRAGRLTMQEVTIPIPPPTTFEAWVDTTYSCAFVDFRSFNQQQRKRNESFYMKGFVHFPEKENWTKIFDGMFYIKEMYPCKR